MAKTIPLVLALAAVFVVGCATDDEVTNEEFITASDYTQGTTGELAPIDQLCPIMVPLRDFGSYDGLYDVQYDQRGRVISTTWDRDLDNAPETSCSYGYQDDRLSVVSADFDLDGVADDWSYVDGTTLLRTAERRSW